MDRRAKALWEGDLKNGRGELSTDSGALKNTPYSFSTRFEDMPGTNPEELIAAAHSGCFNMALAGALKKKGYTADRLETSATVSLVLDGEGYKIASSRLKLRAQVADIDEKTFRVLAEDARVNCPVSKALSIEIKLDIDFHQSVHAGAAH